MENSAADHSTKGTRAGRTTCVFHPFALTPFRAADLTDINTLRFTLAHHPVTFRTTDRCGEGSEAKVGSVNSVCTRKTSWADLTGPVTYIWQTSPSKKRAV